MTHTETYRRWAILGHVDWPTGKSETWLFRNGGEGPLLFRTRKEARLFLKIRPNKSANVTREIVKVKVTVERVE